MWVAGGGKWSKVKRHLTYELQRALESMLIDLSVHLQRTGGVNSCKRCLEHHGLLWLQSFMESSLLQQKRSVNSTIAIWKKLASGQAVMLVLHNNWQWEKKVASLLHCLLWYISLWHVAKVVVGSRPAMERRAALKTTVRKRKAEAGRENAKSPSPTEGVTSVVWVRKVWRGREEHPLRNTPVWVCSLATLSCCLSVCPFNPTAFVYSDHVPGSQMRKEIT